MSLLFFLVRTAGATMLLPFAARIARSEFERLLRAAFRRHMLERENLPRNAHTGTGPTVVLNLPVQLAGDPTLA